MTQTAQGAIELIGALRATARGRLNTQAAIELLLHHDHWLTYRPDFVRDFVAVREDGYAAVLWREAVKAVESGTLYASTSQEGILRIAASLYAGTPVDLRDATRSLDRTNSRLVVRALADAVGVEVPE